MGSLLPFADEPTQEMGAAILISLGKVRERFSVLGGISITNRVLSFARGLCFGNWVASLHVGGINKKTLALFLIVSLAR